MSPRKKLKILFFTSELPYPPRNGVTIPIFYMIEYLKKHHDVTVSLVSDSLVDEVLLSQNIDKFGTLPIIHRKRRGRLESFLCEMLKIRPTFLSWNYQKDDLEKVKDLRAFDVIWGSPINVLDVPFLNGLCECIGPNKSLLVTTISDSYTSVLRNARIEGTLKERITAVISRFRSVLMAYHEAKILRKYDHVFVQTDKDRMWINTISNNELNNSVHVMPNGVNPLLLGIPIVHNKLSQELLYVGSLSDMHYRNRLKWFLKDVWPQVRYRCPEATFSVIGKGASADSELIALLRDDSKIEYKEFVENIVSIYQFKTILVAPIFKNHGLINKVVEGMAAGTVVVGDKSAFNGIDGFVDGTHGVIADDASSMIDTIVKLLSDADSILQIAQNARVLMDSNFKWSSRGDMIDKILASTFIKNPSQ